MNERTATFQSHRPHLLSLAYRLLGSVADADDVVQEAFVRWQAAEEEEIRSPRAYLTTIVTRLCIDDRRSARARREVLAGPWLPEPLVEAPSAWALAESASIGLLVLLESLSPAERAVYVLHEAFELEYAEIARIVGKTEDNCRQIARRAKAAIAARTPRFAPTRDERQRLATAFAEATRAGDIAALGALLAADVELVSDGGAQGTRFGRTGVATKPLVGKRAVIRFCDLVIANAPVGLATRIVDVNGAPGLLTSVDGTLVSAIAFDVRDGLITAIYIVADPAKLPRSHDPTG